MDQLAGSGGRDQSAAGIRALYFPQDGSLPLVPRGVLPTQSRKGAPEGEARARRRMHDLLKPKSRASVAEERVLRDAGIPLLQRKDGGFCIDPGVMRKSDEAAAVARGDSAVAIAELYGLTEGSTALVPRGVLPTYRRKGAPEGEAKARQRMHDLLKPNRRASVAEERVLRDAGIPLLQRKDGGFCIDPGVERESDEAAAVARGDSAVAIAELYGLTEGSTALVPRGVLPTYRRKGAPEGEAKARQRMHDLLKPKSRVSVAEERVLRDAGIPLLQREGGGFCIDPGVERVSDEAAAVARGDSAVAIAELYGLTEGSTALVPRGVLPTYRRKGAPEGEARARRRMHDLLMPRRRASVAEERVLRDAGIPLLQREGGGFCIDPGVMRKSDEAAAVARGDSAVAIAELYGLAEGSTALVPRGRLPAQSREGAPEGEARARRRMHHLLKPKYRASVAEERVLRDAGIPLLQRKGGGFCIDPGVERVSERVGSSAVPVLPSGQWRPVAASVSSLPVAAVPAWSAQFATGATGAAGDPPATGGHEGSHGDGPGLSQAGSGLPPGTGMPWTQDGIPLGQGDDVPPAQAVQPGFPEAQPGFEWGLGVAAPVYSRAGDGVGSLPGDPVTASGRAGYVPVVADGDTDASVSGRPAMPAAGAYLPQGLPVTLGTRAREDTEQPVQGMPADRLKRPRRR
ncbi:prenyltransferase/squalene oxidase repeat-containing protein [Streptomyces sp. MMS24-I2-30]|uniref:prenyltransferase/squalene oxidase repeat-containing protein n=1 Tax=Streptomyces sp. MMS24-I2-30 TaxID=3351564 RepID=UPI003896B9A7